MDRFFILVKAKEGMYTNSFLGPVLRQLRSPNLLIVHVNKSHSGLCDFILEVYSEHPAMIFEEGGLIRTIEALPDVRDVKYFAIESEIK